MADLKIEDDTLILTSDVVPWSNKTHRDLIHIELMERMMWLSDGEEDYAWGTDERREQDQRIRQFRESFCGYTLMSCIVGPMRDTYKRMLRTLIWGG